LERWVNFREKIKICFQIHLPTTRLSPISDVERFNDYTGLVVSIYQLSFAGRIYYPGYDSDSPIVASCRYPVWLYLQYPLYLTYQGKQIISIPYDPHTNEYPELKTKCSLMNY